MIFRNFTTNSKTEVVDVKTPKKDIIKHPIQSDYLTVSIGTKKPPSSGKFKEKNLDKSQVAFQEDKILKNALNYMFQDFQQINMATPIDFRKNAIYYYGSSRKGTYSVGRIDAKNYKLTEETSGYLYDDMLEYRDSLILARRGLINCIQIKQRSETTLQTIMVPFKSRSESLKLQGDNTRIFHTIEAHHCFNVFCIARLKESPMDSIMSIRLKQRKEVSTSCYYDEHYKNLKAITTFGDNLYAMFSNFSYAHYVIGHTEQLDLKRIVDMEEKLGSKDIDENKMEIIDVQSTNSKLLVFYFEKKGLKSNQGLHKLHLMMLSLEKNEIICMELLGAVEDSKAGAAAGEEGAVDEKLTKVGGYRLLDMRELSVTGLAVFNDEKCDLFNITLKGISKLASVDFTAKLDQVRDVQYSNSFLFIYGKRSPPLASAPHHSPLAAIAFKSVFL